MNTLSITINTKDEIERFKETIHRPLKKNQIPFKLKSIYSQDLFFWGFTSSNRNLDIWKKISIKDYVIFFSNNLIYISIIDDKIRNKDIAYFLWNKCHSYPSSFELLLVFTKIIAISAEMEEYKIFKKYDMQRNSITFLNYIDMLYPNLQNLFKNSVNEKYQKYNSHGWIPIDYKEPPLRTNYFTGRIIRDTIKQISSIR